jgi:hypothetical protein
MTLSSQKRITEHHRLAAVVAFALSFSAEAVLAQPAAPNATAPSQPQSQNPASALPGWQRFEIRQDTPSEREAFLKKREEILALHPPHDVPPLPEQAIVPPVSQKP